jgi:hypothetical protein
MLWGSLPLLFRLFILRISGKTPQIPRPPKSPDIYWQDGSRNTSPSCQRGNPLWTSGHSALRFSRPQNRKGSENMNNKNTGGKYAANRLITLRVTPEEKKRLVEYAALIGSSLSDYLRHRIFGGRPIIPRADEWAIRELRRMGGLLKHNFDTLRQAKVGPDCIKRHEELLRAIAAQIEHLGKKYDREENQKQEDGKDESAADR